MTSTHDVVGAAMAELAMTELGAAARRDADRPALFVRSLQELEVVAFARVLREFRLPGRAAPVETRVGTVRPLAGLPVDVRLGDGRTLTSYRNTNEAGLVLVELDSYSDAQGLANLRTLDDATILADLDEDVRRERTRTIVGSAWRLSVSAPERSSPPQQLVNRFTEVHALLARLGTTSLRVWVRFAIAATEALTDEAVAAHASVDKAVGESLTTLGLFPDERLFADPQTLKKRLQDNFNLAQGRGPTGRELQEDELVGLINTVDLPAELLASVGIPDAREARDRMREVAEGGGESERSRVPFDLWLHLFSVRPDRASLGARIRLVFEEQFNDRVAEFDDLGIETSLDNGEQDAAEMLLRAEPASDERPLADLLPGALRRRLDKLATPRAITESDPLRALLYGLEALERSSTTDQRTITLSREHVRADEGDLSTAIFAFLYGPTLSELGATSGDGVGAVLNIDPSLTNVPSLMRLRAQRDTEENQPDPNVRWAPLRLVLRADGQMDPLYRFQWKPLDNPGIVALAALVANGAVPMGTRLDATMDEWLADAVDVQRWTDGSWFAPDVTPTSGPLVEEWVAARATLFAGVAERGIDESALTEYVERWATILDSARAALIPQQSPLTELDQFLSVDTVRLRGGRLGMLATHPLRLRWLASHLANMKALVSRSLDAGLVLNEHNDQLFFDWLDRVSPHRQPPFVSGDGQQLAIPVRETGMHEEYALIHASGAESRDWLSGIDDSSVDAIGAIARGYLDAYPHKRDGLSILLLLRDGDPAVAWRLLKQIRSKDYVDARVVLHVLTGRAHHDAVGRVIEELLATGTAIPDRFIPDVELLLHDWTEGDDDPDLSGLVNSVDIAIAPNLFGTKTSAQPSTRRRDSGLAGSFDPWIDAATHNLRTGGVASENVSKVLLPSRPDPILEAWSTLSVRRFRNAPVSPDADDSTDYLALQVQFHVGAPLFESLHSVAHWVVTLDPFVGRDQIDALAGRPDVILVRGGVGKNRTYTLVVSSKTGARHVTHRLARKLEHDFRIELPAPAADIARRLYEVGRNSFPGVMLRALGLGRAAEEVLGLIVSRHVVEETYPVPSGADGLEWWVALDEHVDWFGGAQRVRADLLRIVAVQEDGALSLRLIVVESKFRGSEDAGVLAIADQQLTRTIALLGEAFRDGSTPEIARADDARFWMRELVDALDQTSKATLPASELPALRLLGRGSVDVLRSALMSAEVRVDEILGVVVGVAYDAPAPAAHGVTPAGHQMLRINGPELTKTLRWVLDGSTHAHDAADEDRSLDLTEQPVVPDAKPPEQPSEGHDARGADKGPDSTAPVVRHRGMSQAELDARYQKVLDVFAAHSVRVGTPPADGTDQGPGFYVVRVVPEVGVSVDKLLNRSEDLKLALRLEASQHIRAFVDRGSVVLEVPKSDAERYGVATSDLWAKTAWRSDVLYLPVGEDIAGDVVGVELSSADSPHLLIGGATGSGKSVLIESLLQAATHQYPPSALRLHLVDPKGTELIDFEDSAHVEGPIGFSSDDAIDLLDSAVGEMQSRYELFKQRRVRSIVEFNALEDTPVMPWWIVVLDEYADLTSDSDDKSRIEKSLKRLAQKARAAGIHLVVATQKPSAEVISTTVRSNLPAQIGLRVKTSSDSRIIMDEAGAESLAGKGDAFLKTAKGLTRFQCAQYDGNA